MSDTSQPVVLTIAGFDPSSGAGMTADLKTFAAHGLYGVSCITALTVQSTQGVRRVAAVDSTIVGETLALLAEDVTIAGVKIGMLGSAPVVEVVADFLSRAGIEPGGVVLDPVLRSSSGASLLDNAGLRVMQQRLLTLVGWITPNLDELAVLLSSPSSASPAPPTREVVPEQALFLREAAQKAGNPALNIVVTGGHLDRPDDYFLEADSGLMTQPGGVWIPGERVETRATHGTGCAFSSALLAQLVRGVRGVEAVTAAKAYVLQALKHAYPVGKGRGPMNHLFRLDGLESDR